MGNRWILHVDMNCYFASVEQQCNPALRGRPIGVGGKPGTRSVIAAASREAKVRGVKTAMSSWEAMRICPELIIVEPDYRKYQAYSERLFGILESISPQLEIFSIDEAFVEVTQPQHCTQNDAESTLRPSANTPVDVSPLEVSWLTATVQRIKTLLHTHLGAVLTASIGLSRSKRLAKLASESQKPNGFTVLLGDKEAELVARFQSLGVRAFTRAALYAVTPVEELAGIGSRLGRRLRGSGIHTLADLATRSLDELRPIVFPYERELYLVGRGLDPSPVVPYWRALPEQSIGHQYTLPSDTAVVDLPPTLMWLAERVGQRLRAQGFVAKHLSLYLRQTHATGWGSGYRTSTYLESDTALYKAAWYLIHTACEDPLVPLSYVTPIRMPSLTVSELVPTRAASRSFLAADQRSQALTRALDAIRNRYGNQSIRSGLSTTVHHHVIPDGRRKRFTPDLTATAVVHSDYGLCSGRMES
ncbi:DNA polymerase IV [Candidatus Berkelbacteria bacterium]|nr:DNA polymerase IV [Candidatus Berkelbacteria bacterium]